MTEPWHKRFSQFISVDEQGVLTFLPPRPPSPPRAPPQRRAADFSLGPLSLDTSSSSEKPQQQKEVIYVSSGGEEEEEPEGIPRFEEFLNRFELKNRDEWEQQYGAAVPILADLEQKAPADMNSEFLRKFFFYFIYYYHLQGTPHFLFTIARAMEPNTDPADVAALRDRLLAWMTSVAPAAAIQVDVPLIIGFEVKDKDIQNVRMGLDHWDMKTPVAFLNKNPKWSGVLTVDIPASFKLDMDSFKVVHPYPLSDSWSKGNLPAVERFVMLQAGGATLLPIETVHGNVEIKGVTVIHFASNKLKNLHVLQAVLVPKTVLLGIYIFFQ